MKRTVTIACVLAISLAAGWAGAQAQPAFRAKVGDAFGQAQKRVAGASGWQDISVGDLLAPQTSVKTGDDSAVLLQLPDRHVLRIGANSLVELRELGANKSYSFRVLSGKIWSLVESATRPTKYEVETPSAVAGVEGTLFSVFHEEDSGQTAVSTDEGQVRVRQGRQGINVGAGYSTRVRRNQRVPLQVAQQAPAMRQMWQMVRQRESWIRPQQGAKMRLNRDVERNMGLFARRARQQQAAQPGQQEQPKPPEQGQGQQQGQQQQEKPEPPKPDQPKTPQADQEKEQAQKAQPQAQKAGEAQKKAAPKRKPQKAAPKGKAKAPHFL